MKAFFSTKIRNKSRLKKFDKIAKIGEIENAIIYFTSEIFLLVYSVKKAILQSDFNFTEAPAVDCIPARKYQKSPKAAFELTELRKHLGKHLGGMIDAFRAAHGLKVETTHHGQSHHTKSRHDRSYIPTTLALNHKAPALRNTRHIPRIDLTIRSSYDGKIIKSDHDAVVTTIRLSDIKEPPKAWKYTRPDSPSKIIKVNNAVQAAIDQSKDSKASPDEAMAAIAKAAKDTRIAQKKAHWEAHTKKVIDLKNKINSLERSATKKGSAKKPKAPAKD